MNKAGGKDDALTSLRALVPRQATSFLEALRVAEIQAERLLVILDVPAPPVPHELITELPNIDIRLDAHLPASGSAHWENGQWVITLKSGEAMSRRRFSLMHEFKHVLDHPTRDLLYGDTIGDPVAAYRAERAADQFAACVLMPERWIKREWFVPGHRLNDVAVRFGVSTRALSVRLWLLGMAPEVRRWATMPKTAQDETDPTRYFRPLSKLEVE